MTRRVEVVTRLLDRLPSRTFWGVGGPYLTRYTLFRVGAMWPKLYLHCFHRSDEDAELHSHPWNWAAALILKGGYTEHRAEGAYTRNPGSVVLLADGVYHRVDLHGEESWSLFLAGPRSPDGNWWFWNPNTGARTHWREFIGRKAGIDIHV